MAFSETLMSPSALRFALVMACALATTACDSPLAPITLDGLCILPPCPPIVNNDASPWIEVHAQRTTVHPGDTVRITAIYHDSTDRVVPNVQFTWRVGPTGVLDVDSTGLMRAVAVGEDYVEAYYGDRSGIVAIRVTPRGG